MRIGIVLHWRIRGGASRGWKFLIPFTSMSNPSNQEYAEIRQNGEKAEVAMDLENSRPSTSIACWSVFRRRDQVSQVTMQVTISVLI
jgi:hypothetical protein